MKRLRAYVPSPYADGHEPGTDPLAFRIANRLGQLGGLLRSVTVTRSEQVGDDTPYIVEAVGEGSVIETEAREVREIAGDRLVTVEDVSAI